MDDFTITEMHYLVVSLFCDLVRPLFLFIFTDVSAVTALFALFHKHSIYTNRDIAPMPQSRL